MTGLPVKADKQVGCSEEQTASIEKIINLDQDDDRISPFSIHWGHLVFNR